MIILPILVLYMFPWFIAAIRYHHQLGAIFVVNFFLGWTFIGWVVALAWACSAVRPRLGS